MSLTMGTLLQNEYHWAPKNIGLYNIALIVGSLFNVPFSGYLSDYAVKALAKRNNGVHQVRLQLFSLPILVLMLSGKYSLNISW